MDDSTYSVSGGLYFCGTKATACVSPLFGKDLDMQSVTLPNLVCFAGAAGDYRVLVL